jgi:PD-(D/E)XK nuclease superfamily
VTTLAEAQLDGFFHNLEFRFSTADELDLQLARHFNVFRCFAPSEPRLSAIIRDLLDPRGIHGQGDVFLRHFLETIGLGNLAISRNVAIRCEELTRHCDNPLRRIDLFVSPDGIFGIGIENKPWAGDQKGWVRDYSTHLARQSGNHFCLVFLMSAPVQKSP